MREITLLNVEHAIAAAWVAFRRHERSLDLDNPDKADETYNRYLDAKERALGLAQAYGIPRLIKAVESLP